MDTLKALLSVEETCGYLAIGRTLLYDYVKAGEIRVIKLGKRTLFAKKDLDAFLESRSKSGS